MRDFSFSKPKPVEDLAMKTWKDKQPPQKTVKPTFYRKTNLNLAFCVFIFVENDEKIIITSNYS